MRARLIVNPKAGPNRALELLPRILERLRQHASQLDVTVTAQPEEASKAAASAVVDGCSRLYVAGGDGTVNGVLRGLVSGTGHVPPIAIGVLPLGTGNDLARALDLGEDVDAAVEALLSERAIDVDVGLINDRPFVNTSAGGFVADVSALLTEPLKNSIGRLAYIVGGARAIFESEPFSAQVRGRDAASADLERTLEVQMFAACNALYIGGGYPMAPAAFLDDGLLDVYLVQRSSMLDFAIVLQRIAVGEHHTDERVTYFQASDFALSFDRKVRVNTDGEIFEADRCHYRVRPGAATFLCGARPRALRPPRSLAVR